MAATRAVFPPHATTVLIYYLYVIVLSLCAAHIHFSSVSATSCLIVKLFVHESSNYCLRWPTQQKTTCLSFTLVTRRTLCSLACELSLAHSAPLHAHLVNPLTSDLSLHLLSPVSPNPILTPTQCSTHLLSHETKKERAVKINGAERERERVHRVYLCARERTEKIRFPWKLKSCV